MPQPQRGTGSGAGAATEGFHASEEQLVTGGSSDGQVHVVVAVVLQFRDEGGLLSAQPAHPVTNRNLAPAGAARPNRVPSAEVEARRTARTPQDSPGQAVDAAAQPPWILA